MKHLVAKLLTQLLEENIFRKQKGAFLLISAHAKKYSEMEGSLRRLARILGNYGTDRKRQYLRDWYRRALNAVQEICNRNNLLDSKTKFKREQNFFYLWRQAFLNSRKSSHGRSEGSRVLLSLVSRLEHKLARNFLCRWRDFVELRQSQENFMYAVS